ncbi:MAG: SH3 domain-containing protein [Acetatifactor sp.]|nr:SH3 domain-containing protein [Acetatifactor sp.]
MSRVKEWNPIHKVMLAVGTLMLAMVIGLSIDGFAMVSYAQSQGKVTAASAKIRKEASATSEVVGSATKDASVTINGQVTAGDNTVWYQIFVDANTLGYIRSDLVSITDGSTPKTITAGSTAATSSESTASDTNTVNPVTTPPTAVVTQVNPVSANVTNGESVRVRSDASTSSQIVTTAKSGVAVTVIGQADGSDGKVWYQVNFIANGTDVTGFIRSDFLALSGEVTPYTEESQEVDATGEEAEEVAETPTVTKDWDTQWDVDKWYLIDNLSGERYKIQDMFDVAENNRKMYEAENQKVKSQKILVIFLVFVIVALGGAVAYLIFRMRDMQDAAYFAQVEKETIRRRTAERPSGSGQKVMHNVGTDKRPGGARPAGTAPAQGRPVQGRPAGVAPAQGRPVQGRPAGAAPAQGRPAQGRPAGAAPAQGRPVQGRPAGAAPAQGRPTQERPAQPEQSNKGTGWKSKNFMADEDEFEFEFLNNWDGEDDNF